MSAGNPVQVQDLRNLYGNLAAQLVSLLYRIEASVQRAEDLGQAGATMQAAYAAVNSQTAA